MEGTGRRSGTVADGRGEPSAAALSAWLGVTGRVARYGGAVLAAVLATATLGLLVPAFGEGPNATPFVLFFAAVMLAAWYGGFGPALLATLLCAAASWYFFLSPQFSFALESFGQGLRIVVFVLEGALIGALAEAMRSARRRAEASARLAAENEARLRESEERLLLALDASGLGTWEYDPATGGVRADDRAGEILGLAAGGLESFLGRVHPGDRERVGEKLRRVAREGGEYAARYRVEQAGGGAVRWVEARGRADAQGPGRVSRIVGTVMDVTARETAQAELRGAREELEVILGGVADAVTAQDLEGRVIYANEAAADMFGYASRGEVLGPQASDAMSKFRVLDQEGNPFLLDRLPGRRALTGEVGAEEVLRFSVPATGEEKWALVKAAPVLDEDGAVRMAVNMIRDVTEQRRTAEVAREIKEAERRRIARDLHDGVLQDLSYTAAALGLIMIGAERTSVEDEMQRAIDAVRRAAQDLRDVVNDLRLEEKQDRPFIELVESLVLRNRVMAREMDVDLKAEGEPLSTPLGATGTEVLRVIQEALTNARRHAGASRALVMLETEGDDLRVEVVDDGRGFDPEVAARESSGVGLTGMRERVAAIGGRLEIRSELDGGTRVTLRAPMPERKGRA